jgi:hypothetical protein
MPAQWALQYFEASAGMQEQAGFSHFFGCAIASPLHPLESQEAQRWAWRVRCLRPGKGW